MFRAVTTVEQVLKAKGSNTKYCLWSWDQTPNLIVGRQPSLTPEQQPLRYVMGKFSILNEWALFVIIYIFLFTCLSGQAMSMQSSYWSFWSLLCRLWTQVIWEYMIFYGLRGLLWLRMWKKKYKIRFCKKWLYKKKIQYLFSRDVKRHFCWLPLVMLFLCIVFQNPLTKCQQGPRGLTEN